MERRARNKRGGPRPAACRDGYRCLRGNARRSASWPSGPSAGASPPLPPRAAGCGRCPAIVRRGPSFQALRAFPTQRVRDIPAILRKQSEPASRNAGQGGTGLMRVSMYPSALLVLLSLAGSAAAQSPADFYKGKNVELYIGYSVGGGYDVYARLLARHMGKHIPGNPTVVPKNMEGA